MNGFFRNQQEEFMQRVAWRLVRSAEDRIPGNNRGAERLSWCVDRLIDFFPKEKKNNLEDYVRAAFVQFKSEQKAVAY